MSIHPQHAPDGWNICNIGQLGQLVGGATPSTAADGYFGGDIVWLAPSDLTPLSDAEIYISNSATKLSAAGFKSCSTKLLPEGAICMSSRATLGECAIAAVPLCTNQGFISIVCNPEIDNRFLLYWIKQNASYISRFSAGTTFLEIPRRTFGSLRVCLPTSKQEQARIADLINAVDRTIAATQASIDAAQKLKRGLIQNLLTGKLKPDGTWRRDDEFDIDLKIGRVPKTWSIGKFKDFFVLQRGADLTDAEHKHGSVPVVKSNGIDGHHDVALVKAPGVTTGRSGTIGQVFYIEEDFWPHNTALYVKDFKGNYPRFCYYLISLMQFDKFAAGTGVPTLNRRDIHVQRICIPDESEQKEICKILDNCDAEIESRKKKLALLQRVKKSLMQNLLTGKVRIPPGLKIE